MTILNLLLEKKEVSFEDLYQFFKEDFPLLNKLKDTEQDLVWHAEGDVYIHTKMVLEKLYSIINNYELSNKEYRILVLSAFFHDIGKPLTTKSRERDGRIQIISPKHEYVGMSYIFYRLLKYNLDIEEIKLICSLVGYHQIPKLLVIKNEDFRKYIDLYLKTDLRLIYILEQADLMGRVCEDYQEQLEYLELFKLYSEEYNLWNKEFQFNRLNFLHDYSFYRGIKSYINGEIYQIEESNSKFYNKEYSKVILMTGISGTGKSFYVDSFISNNSNYYKLSLDDLRKEYPKQSRKNDGFIIQKFKEQLKEYLAKNKNVIIDSTNYRKDFRTKIIDLVENYNGYVEIHFIFDELKNILTKNKNRKDSLDNKVILQQLNRFEYPETNETYCIKYIDLRNY